MIMVAQNRFEKNLTIRLLGVCSVKNACSFLAWYAKLPTKRRGQSGTILDS